jgi:hypothetical protein
MSTKAKTNPRESTVIGFYKFDIETGVDASCRLAMENIFPFTKYFIIDMRSIYYIYSVKFQFKNLSLYLTH